MHMRLKFLSRKNMPNATNRLSGSLLVLALVVLLVPVSALIIAASLGVGGPTKIASAQALRSTRLDAKFVDAKSRIVSDTLVESVFKAKLRAYGGDIYLPAYAGDMVWKPAFTNPLEASNAIIPGSATIRIDADDAKGLSSENGRYILKEYEDVDVTITVTSRIIPSAMTTSRLVFKTQLATLIWRPVVQEFNEDEVGNPLLEITPLGWETNPVIVFNHDAAAMPAPSTYVSPAAESAEVSASAEAEKRPKQKVGMASVFGIFSQLQSQLLGLFLK